MWCSRSIKVMPRRRRIPIHTLGSDEPRFIIIDEGMNRLTDEIMNNPLYENNNITDSQDVNVITPTQYINENDNSVISPYITPNRLNTQAQLYRTIGVNVKYDRHVQDYMSQTLKKPSCEVESPIITGYYVQRPKHIEIYVKSPLMAEIFKINNENQTTQYSHYGRLYRLNNYDELGMSGRMIDALSHLNSILVDSYNMPNMTFLRSINIAEGIKTKIKGMFTKDDIENYQSLFKANVTELVNLYKDYKSRPKKKKTNDNELVAKIRKHQYRDRLGFAHKIGCTCIFDSNQNTVKVCSLCYECGVESVFGYGDTSEYQNIPLRRIRN